MSIKLKPWQHALASLLIALGLVLLVYFAIVFPVQSKKQQVTENLETVVFQLNKFKAIADNKTQIQTDLNKIRVSTENNNDFIESQSKTLSSADLQKKIKLIIQQSNGALVSIQNVNTSNDENFDSVGLKINMTGSTDAIKNVLYQMSIQKPLLFINNIIIQNRNRNANNPANSGKGTIEFRFDISAYLLNKELY